MIQNLFYLVLAAFGLGFLIFIHELGHYFMALKVGMKVEAFGIGFGKPILSWKHKGVQWNLGVLPFGGYVRIAGMEKQGHLEPYQIPDGFYGKSPFDRIKVALMGPCINIAFALLAFTAIWATGGRQKFFSEFTHLIGWVDPQSKLYEIGIRPGDEISQLDQRPFEGFNDLRYALILGERNPQIKGYEVEYATHQRLPFETRFGGDDLKAEESLPSFSGTLTPATFLLYDRFPDGKDNPLPEGSPLLNSGIQYKDRLIWIDGQILFSKTQLVHVLNEPKALLTVQRGASIFLSRVPRLHISDLCLTTAEKAELNDWQHEAALKGRAQQLFFIPYNLSRDCVVENPLRYIDENVRETPYLQPFRSSQEAPLLSGDRILAVDGAPVTTSFELLSRLQERKVQVIVQRESVLPSLSWKAADSYFGNSIDWNAIHRIASSIGTSHPLQEAGNLHLLSPVAPRPLNAFPLSEEKKAQREALLNAQKKEIETIKDPQERAQQLQLLEENEKRLMLGVGLQDLQVTYNPSPFKLFLGVFQETYRTLLALVTGYLSPKWMAGPVGIVQVIHYGWMVGIKEALFWMGVISLNLGLLNLLPLPVLDGGHICFALVEKVTKKHIKAKTMERLVIPFIVLLVGLFIYLTYNDLLRLFKRFF